MRAIRLLSVSAAFTALLGACEAMDPTAPTPTDPIPIPPDTTPVRPTPAWSYRAVPDPSTLDVRVGDVGPGYRAVFRVHLIRDTVGGMPDTVAWGVRGSHIEASSVDPGVSVLQSGCVFYWPNPFLCGARYALFEVVGYRPGTYEIGFKTGYWKCTNPKNYGCTVFRWVPDPGIRTDGPLIVKVR